MAGETSTTFGTSADVDRERDQVVIRVPTPGRIMRQLLPDDAVKHMQAAQKEQLLALRCMIDAAIKRIEENQSEKGSGGIRRAEIRVE